MSLRENILWIEAISLLVVQVIDSFMLRHDFSRSDYVFCVFIRKIHGCDWNFILLYVNDMFISLKSMVEIEMLKTKFGKEFETKELGISKTMLGYENYEKDQTKKLFCIKKGYI